MFLLNKLAMLVYTTGAAQKYMTGCHTSTALSQGYVAQTKNVSEHPRVAFSQLDYPQIGQVSLLDTEFLNNSGDCLTEGLSVSVILTFCKKG